MNRSRRPSAGLLLALCSVVVLAVVFVLVWRDGRRRGEAPAPSDQVERDVSSAIAWLQAREAEADRTVWAAENLAQRTGRAIEEWWEALLASSNKLERASSLPIGEMHIGDWTKSEMLPHGIEVRSPSGATRRLSRAEWTSLVKNAMEEGWGLKQLEFRHNRFSVDKERRPKESRFYFSAHLTNAFREDRVILEGDLMVRWLPGASPGQPSKVGGIDASGLTIKRRSGETPFQLIGSEKIASDSTSFADPLMVYDLDHDGIPEIILAGKNSVYRRRGSRYEAEALCRQSPGAIMTAVLGDFDGDGAVDFLCAKEEGLLLFKGSRDGKFESAGEWVWRATPRLKNAMVLTCGDIDRDGDLDLYLGQYKQPSLGQILRPTYYDANDSFPGFLLLNDGTGHFSDATAAAGLEKKRTRRTFSASFADLDGDGQLDLIVVSDFAGMDLYRNDGTGHFRDMTAAWIAEPHAFGMAHALADFNRDGRTDLLMIGMTSPTVDRLNHLGLWRSSRGEVEMRTQMTFGNRLYLSQAAGGFEQTRWGDTISRTGWAWGCSAFDFDNDGFPDVYIANGHQSKQSVRDYEPEFWLHSLYIDEAIDDTTATAWLLDKFRSTRGSGWSYGGYDKNRLYLNLGAKSFFEIGHLFGVALEQDSRNVVGADLNGDGHVDLVVTTLEAWPEPKQTLQIYENRLGDGGNWIGFRLREEGKGRSPVGATISIQVDGRRTLREIVTGDSFRSQHPATVHFGVGQAGRVSEAMVTWTDGTKLIFSNPEVNRYYEVHPPAPSPK